MALLLIILSGEAFWQIFSYIMLSTLYILSLLMNKLVRHFAPLGIMAFLTAPVFLPLGAFTADDTAIQSANNQCFFGTWEDWRSAGVLGKGDSHWESCYTIYLMANGEQVGTRVTWLSDGKVVDYYNYDCIQEGPSHDCKVKIVEDNGTVTYGTSSSGGRGTFVESSRGNITHWMPSSNSNEIQID